MVVVSPSDKTRIEPVLGDCPVIVEEKDSQGVEVLGMGVEVFEGARVDEVVTEEVLLFVGV